MRMTKLIVFILLIISSLHVSSQDSLKVYVVGYFKNEIFKIYHDSTIFTIKAKNSRGVINGTQGFTFKIPKLKDTSEYVFLNMVIFRKSKYGIFYRNTKLYILNDTLDYLVITRNFRQRNRYPLCYYWTCKPPNNITISYKFWQYDNDDWVILDKKSNTNGRINVTDYQLSWFGLLFGYW